MRLGLYRMSSDHDDLFRAYVDAVRPAWVFFLDPGPGDEPLAAWCRERDVNVGGRVFIEHQRLGAEGGRQVDQVVAAARACPSVTAWQLHNEEWDNVDELDSYAELSIDQMEAMEAIGRLAIIGNFSEGTLEIAGPHPLAEWQAYLPAVQRAIRHQDPRRRHFLGLHEYSGPTVDWGLDPNEPGSGWHTLRYRKHLRVLKELGVDISRIRLLFTEGGIDDVWERPGGNPGRKGWRDWDGTEWSRPPLSSHGDFAGQMAWLYGEYTKDPQVEGGVDFGFAHRDPTWQSFDLAMAVAMLWRIRDVMIALPRGNKTTGGSMNEQIAAALRLAGDRAQVLRLNAAAALQKAALRDGYTVVGNEAEVQAGGQTYVVQKAEIAARADEPRWYYCIKGQWGQVAYLGK